MQAQRDAAYRSRPPADPDSNDPSVPRGEEDQQPPLTPQTPSATIPNRSTNAHEVRELLRRSASGISQGEIASIVFHISHNVCTNVNNVNLPPQTPQPQPPQPAARGIRERLAELRELYEEGVITAEIFAECQRDIICSSRP